MKKKVKWKSQIRRRVRKNKKRKQKNVVTAKEEHVIFCSCRFLRRQKLVVEFERNKTMSSLT